MRLTRVGVAVAGSLAVRDEQPADPIECGSDPFDHRGAHDADGGDYAICIDDPAPDDFDNIKVKIKERR